MLDEPPGAFLSGRNVPLLFDELVTPPAGSSSHRVSVPSREPTSLDLAADLTSAMLVEVFR